MYAIVETGGKQYRVSEGDVIAVEKLDAKTGDKITLEKILVFSDGDRMDIGNPYVEGVSIQTTVLENGKGKKVVVFKFKSKKNYRKKRGHRQPYTKLKIETIASAN